ncbi:MAG: VOC family protein [Nitrospirae bacterium]|nr:MAG: VOC family protein [Nitrospirota bacterium]
MVKYNGINHLALVTGDMDRTVRFWRDLLGFRLVIGMGSTGYKHYFFEVSDTDMIAFFEWPDVGPVNEKEHGRPASGRVAFDHVSIGVENEGDLYEIKDRLDAADIWVSEVIDHGFIHSIYSFDPNGIAIEFSRTIPENDLRSKPKIIDKNPSDITLEGPDPQPGKWPGVVTPTPETQRKVYRGVGSELFQGKKTSG